ncbi:hypothetical protein BUALT_Bualt07G0171300 [Buddleja alternifolia]|uniref:Uncharacterized protein n=1 Tax=Buddleja alternifolia TaxID=168488 RepID=A0AAV6XBK6_9LAMI|nr:hypothetical protein BUALT_Bualt07G0171300 [Buddleja alternifolia]
MQGTQILTKMLCRQHGGAAVALNHQRRWMVGKAGNRAAVHGSKLPVPDTIPREEVEMEINGAIEKKQRKRREIENAVDSHLKNWQVLYIEDFVCSK